MGMEFNGKVHDKNILEPIFKFLTLALGRNYFLWLLLITLLKSNFLTLCTNLAELHFDATACFKLRILTLFLCCH